MAADKALAWGTAYPERAPLAEGAADRLIALAGLHLHNVFNRRLVGAEALAASVARQAAALRGADLAARLPGLRYRLRRDGFRGSLPAEAFAIYAAASGREIPAPVLGAARRLSRGGVVELPGAEERLSALALAAFARAARGDCVHLLAASDVSAQAIAAALRGPFAALGMRVGCIESRMDPAARRAEHAAAVVCAALREMGLDYLRDGIQAGGRPGDARVALERLAGYAPEGRLTLRGLHCALVADADLVLIDDALAPLAITAPADASRERLAYDQALELARALEPGKDFALEADGIRLDPAAAALLERLVAPLGGLWAIREQRENLVLLALEVLHLMQAGDDYQVANGQIVLPPSEGEPAAEDEQLKHLLEIKEGCRFSARRDVVARMSVPRFLRRYLHVAGVCADARGHERELWEFYGLKVAAAGRRAAAVGAAVRIFATAQAKHAALAQQVRAMLAAGSAVGVGARTTRGAKEAHAALGELAQEVTLAVFPARPPAGAKVVLAELYEAPRQVAELCRAAGAEHCEMLLSLEDEALAAHVHPFTLRAARRLAGPSGELRPAVSGALWGLARRRAERTQRGLRLELEARDRMLDDLLAVSGRGA
jgi:preprotein translocase subunit SecA